MCFLQNELASWLPFLLVLATAFSHAAGIYCLMFEMKRWILRCKDWAVSRAGSAEVSTHCAVVMAWPSFHPEVSLKFVCKPSDPFTVPPGQQDGEGLQYCTGMKCPWVKIQDHSCSWGRAGGPSLVLAGCSCGQGAPAELWDCWVGGHWGRHQGRERAVESLHVRAQCQKMGEEWRAGCLPLAGGWWVSVEDSILYSNCRSWPMKLKLGETLLLLCSM